MHPIILHHAKHLLDELDAGRLEVAKIRTENGYIRVHVSVNAEWYSRFCANHLASRRRYRKPRTIIRRCHTRRALQELAEGRCHSLYAQRIRDFIEDWNPVPF